MLPPNFSEPKNTCTVCGKSWEGNPYDFETNSHEFPCPECSAILELATQWICPNTRAATTPYEYGAINNLVRFGRAVLRAVLLERT